MPNDDANEEGKTADDEIPAVPSSDSMRQRAESDFVVPPPMPQPSGSARRSISENETNSTRGGTISNNPRGSQRSMSMYGPTKSRRMGRPDRLQSLLELPTTDQAASASGASSNRDSAPATPAHAGLVADGEEDEHDFILDNSITAGSSTRSLQQALLEKERAAKMQIKAMMRISALAQKASASHPDRLVQVRLKNFSYHVPVQMDAPTKRTVVNQSICYAAFEFFKRMGQLINPPKDKKEVRETARWIPTSIEDLFVPFEQYGVLNNINLCFQPGKAYLVLGPPASGKTSLLKAIAGRLKHAVRLREGETGSKNKQNLSGRIEYNGITVHEDPELVLANVVSFVGQLDIHAPYLTVKETFEFAQKCRKPEKKDEEEGDEEQGEPQTESERISSENLTISGLGLAHVADTFVGNNEVRGVSGGQRRRVTVGEMMQGQTPVACADEISTGLDAAVTYDICKSIVDFAKAQYTTRIMSLLQPGPETFALFDEVVVLSEGYVVYAGPPGDVVPYFASLGYELPATVDVADFLQAVTTVDGGLLFNPDISPYERHLTSEEFAKAFEESQHAKRIQLLLAAGSAHNWKPTELRHDSNNRQTQSRIPEAYRGEFQNSWGTAFKLNLDRHLLLWWRDKGFIIGKTFENIGMAVATGGILFGQAVRSGDIPTEWTQQAVNEYQTISDAVFAALFMTVLHITLGTTTSAPDDLDGRPIHYKQGDANFYQTTAFVMGRLVSTFPQRAIEITAFGIPLYWMVGLDPTPRGFFVYLAILLAFTFALKMLYGIIAQLFPNKNNVLSFGTFLVLLFSLLSGFIVFPSSIPGYYQWLYYANPMAWAFQALLINEFESAKYADYRLGRGSEIGNASTVLLGRGFPSDMKWIGFAFAFLLPYTLVAALILSVVLKQVRIEPIKNTKTHAAPPEIDEQQSNEFNLPFVAVDLTFEDLVYEVKTSTGDGTLQLLNHVNGAFLAGRMCALMGSSGAGKTTLMDVIALRKVSGTISGEVRMNGFLQERTSFLRSSGYVEQFDVQQAELTVRETVTFSARLRLDSNNPVTAKDAGKLRFVDYVMETMELTDIEGFQVGNYEEGGLTFEQRKRLAIAVELAASPSVIFLDEPTSGLDSRGAVVIMRAMKKIADTGRTVCATIHQPSAAVFEMFDDLLLLKKGGEVVYFGELGTESCYLVDYLEGQDAKPIQHGENPAAWMLRAYTGEQGEKRNWKEAFEQSPQFQQMKDKIVQIKANPDESKKISYDTQFAAGSWTRMYLMNARVFTIMRRAPSYNLARLMIAILYAFIVGSVFIRSPTRSKVFQENDVNGILGTMFLALIIMGVVSISMAVPVMKEIRDVFYKHRASGMLGHNSVTAAITIAELPYIVMMSAIFSAVYYAVVGLFTTADQWVSFFGFFALNVAVYVYFGQAFICLVKDVPTAGALVGALIGFNVFFSGYIVKPQYFKGAFQLGYYTAPGRYAFEGLVVTQFRSMDDSWTVQASELSPFWFYNQCPADSTEPCYAPMRVYVNFYFGERFTSSNLPLDLGVLFFCLFLARLLCWISLKKFNYVNT